VLTPEERNVTERRTEPQHVARDRLALTLGDDPVFDANRLPETCLRVARTITRRPDARGARAKKLVDEDAARAAQPRLFRKSGARAHTHAQHDKVGSEHAAVLELDAVRPDGARACLKVKTHPM